MRKYSTLVGLAVMMSAVSAHGNQPNIIYINADDLDVMDVGFNSKRYITPNIDKLRSEGMLFTDGYAPAANCAPCRAACISGQFAARTGVFTAGNSDRNPAQLCASANESYMNTLKMDVLSSTILKRISANAETSQTRCRRRQKSCTP